MRVGLGVVNMYRHDEQTSSMSAPQLKVCTFPTQLSTKSDMYPFQAVSNEQSVCFFHLSRTSSNCFPQKSARATSTLWLIAWAPGPF